MSNDFKWEHPESPVTKAVFDLPNPNLDSD